MAVDRRKRFEAHIRRCDSCARYDRVVGGGVQVFRSLPPLTPSPDFQTRLLGRLYAMEGAGGRHASGASFGVTLMICLALGASAWIPTLRSDADPVRLPPIVAHAPYHDLTPILMRSAAPPLGNAAFQTQPVFYGRNLLLDGSVPVTTLAYRPASSLYPQR